MNSSLILDPIVEALINTHAIEAFPYECCGFLFGDDKYGRHIQSAQRVPNSKVGDKRRRFEIAALDYLRAEQFALQHSTHLLGIYHSHPNHPAIASKHDLAKAMPYFSYVIASVTTDKVIDLKSWKLLDDKREFAEEQIYRQHLFQRQMIC